MTKLKVKQCGIYCFQNKINGKKYIGQSVDLETRKKCFGKKYQYSGTFFQNAINKYGAENFQHTILTHCKKEELNYFEQFYISRLKTHDRKYGYNCTSGGDSKYFRTEECKKNMRNAWTEERRAKQSKEQSGKKNANYGKRWNDTQKRHASVIKKEIDNKKFFELHGFDTSELYEKIIEYLNSKETTSKAEVAKHFNISFSRIDALCKKYELLNTKFLEYKEKNKNNQKKPVVQCEMNNHDKILNIFPSLSEAEQITGMQSIKHCVYKHQYHAYGYFWRFAYPNEKPFDRLNKEYFKPTSFYKKPSPEGIEVFKKTGKAKKPSLYKKVFCYNNNGQLHKIYECARSAEKDGFRRSCVLQCCSSLPKTSKTHKNYVFSHEELTPNEVFERFNNNIKKPVAMMNKEGETLKTYKSITLAAKDNGLLIGNISACCYGKTKTCGGYKWCFTSN